jgi:hypothetical protein
MRGVRHVCAPLSLVLTLLCGPSVGRAQEAAQAATTAPSSAKIWVGKAAEFEAYLKTAEILELQDIPIGVTKPRRARLTPGGPVDALAWKPIRPGMYGGFWESYKSEIAAYELDKLLNLDMVPPKVERRVKGDVGVAVMWCAGVRSFKDMGGVPGTGQVPGPPPTEAARWNRQIIRAKMFDNLVGNLDPNLGNWLVDHAWNLILIDHTRALTSTKNLVHIMNRIDADLWGKMKALDEAALTAALGSWIGKGEIRSVLARRDRMQQSIDDMVKAQGEANVFVR